MSSRIKIWTSLILLLTGSACLRAAVQVGDAFPALSLAGPAGASLPAATGKVMLVDFWASRCAPCKESFPAYAQLHSDYGARGLVIVAVSVDEKQAAFDSFVRKMGPPFVVLRDQDQRLVRLVSVPAMPTCYVLSRDGRVRFVHPGFHGAETDRLMRKEIDALLAENPPAS